jgi:hypothetical protein
VTLRAPFPWFGCKTRIAREVWQRLGDVDNYVEPFAGSLGVLLARPHAPRLETVNDLDADVANFWRATVADPDAVAEACDYPVNEVDLHARHVQLVQTAAEHRERMFADPEYFDARRAGWWVWGLSQWIGDGWCDGSLSRGVPKLAAASMLHTGARVSTRCLPRCAGGCGTRASRVVIGRACALQQ